MNSFYLIIGVLLFLVQCERNIDLPQNYNFSISGEVDSFNFSKREFTRRYYGDSVSVNVTLTETEILQINEWYIKYKINEIKENYEPRGTFNSLPVFNTILIVNNTRVIISSDTSFGIKDYFKVKRINKFIHNVLSLVRNKDEVKQLPSTDIVFF